MSRPTRFQEGTRVRFEPKPTSFALYESPPAPGEEGTVVSVPVGRGKRTFVPGPGGGLVYVTWAKTGVMGVSPIDLVHAKGAAKKTAARKGNPTSEDEIISAEDVASLPVGSIVFELVPLWPRASGGPLIVVHNGGLLPTNALPSSHEFSPPPGEPAAQWKDRFVVAKRGTGKVPLRTTADRAAIAWIDRRRKAAKAPAARQGNPAKGGKTPAATAEEAQALALLVTTQGDEGPWLAPVSIATWQSLVAKGWAAGSKTKERHITPAGMTALRMSRAYKKAVASGDEDAVYTLANLAKGRKHNPAASRFEVWSQRGMREYATGSFEKARSEAQTCCGAEPTYIVDTQLEGDNVVWRSTGAKGHHRRENPAKPSVNAPRYTYLGQCDRLRRGSPRGEEAWQTMVREAKPITLAKFLAVADLEPLLDEDETPSAWLNALDSPQFYASRWEESPAVYVQSAGFEFIFVRDSSRPPRRQENPKGKAPKREVEVSPALRDMVRKATGKACFKKSCFLPVGSKAGR